MKSINRMTITIGVFLAVGAPLFCQENKYTSGESTKIIVERGSIAQDSETSAAGSQPSASVSADVQSHGASSSTPDIHSVDAMSKADRLWEIEQIHQLKARYFRFLDTKQWKEFRSLFTDDFKWYEARGDGYEIKHASPEAFIRWQSAQHDDARAISAHQGHMPEIELTSDRTARGIWAMFDWVDLPKKRAFQGFGHYYEEYEKGADGKWRIKSIRLGRLRVDQVRPSQQPNKEYPRGLAPWWPPRPHDGQ